MFVRPRAFYEGFLKAQKQRASRYGCTLSQMRVELGLGFRGSAGTVAGSPTQILGVNPAGSHRPLSPAKGPL